MTDDELKAMRGRCEAVPNGPWKPYLERSGAATYWHVRHCATNSIPCDTEENASFIANARTDLPRCLDEIADLKRENAYLIERATETNTTVTDLKRRLAEAEQDIARLRELLTANASPAVKRAMDTFQRGMKITKERDEARAEAAALREAAETSDEALLEALSQPGPGAALLERVRKLEAVAEAAKYLPSSHELLDSLAALEEKP